MNCGCSHNLTVVVNTGLGFHIRGGADEHNAITISTIAERGSAAADGRLKVGDIILSVSTIIDITKMSFHMQ